MNHPYHCLDYVITFRDCGLAVVLMVLHYVGLQHVDFTMLRGLCPTTRCGISSKEMYLEKASTHSSLLCHAFPNAQGPFIIHLITLRDKLYDTAHVVPYSIWTVDLAHLMRRFGLDVWFYTVTLGPNPQYAHESFYMVSNGPVE